MGNLDLIAAAQSGELQTVRDLLTSKVDVNQQDQQGWTALHYASGKGELDLVKILVESGADVFGKGRDQRTPYSIALASGRADVALYLRGVEDATAAEELPRPPRKYCKAYYLSDLRKYANWKEGSSEGAELTDQSIVFVHQDHTVTRSMWPDQDVIFSEAGSEWTSFCAQELGFRVPDDLDLIPSTASA